MSDDKNSIAGGLLNNPLPIVMVVLLAAGVLVKNVALESARPTDPERVRFVPTSQQDVEARLWQDPFAAIETRENSSNQTVRPEAKLFRVLPSPRTLKAQREHKKYEQCSDLALTSEQETSPASHTAEALCENIKKRQNKGIVVTVIAVSVSGASYAEAAESRRRTRFAVISAFGVNNYHPENAEAIGYFHSDQSQSNSVELTVPFEWFKKRDESSNVLVLWLAENKLSTTSTPLNELHHLFNKLTPPDLAGGLRFKLIGPADSAMLIDLVRKNTDPEQKLIALKSGSTIEVFSPNSTISSCDLKTSGTFEDPAPWNCFMKDQSTQPTDQRTLSIVRTTGTDDVLAAALLWELWQRGVNRVQGDKIQCADGLVLISELDTEYGRTLSRYLKDGFSERCGATTPPPIRTFNYLRGLDGVLPDVDKSGSKAPTKDDSSRPKDLRAQLEATPPEHAEGRNQFDYMRRLADEIERLDQKKQIAENGVKAIGIVGSDVYDKLLILQALRSRFKDKIFFTTDLDARYLHADQKDWARNLVVASNFGFSLRPKLQQSTLPFRDSYQTATYLATLMAIENQPFDWTIGMENWLRPGLQQSNRPFLDSYLTASYLPPPMAHKQPFDWTEWLRPQIFEIGRTEAVHLASPSVKDLTHWIKSDYSEGSAPRAKDTKCNGTWTECENIEPDWPPLGLSLKHLPALLVMFILGVFLLILTNSSVHQTVRTAFDPSSPERNAGRTMLYLAFGAVVVMFTVLARVWILMDKEFTQGVGEPFVLLEGISVWPSIVIRFVGLVTVLVLWYVLKTNMRQQKERISEAFEIALPSTPKSLRTPWSAVWSGPHLDLASFDREGKRSTKGIAESKTEVTTLWQNYLYATSFREKAWWVVVSVVLVFFLFIGVFTVLGGPSFPHRGQLVKTLHDTLVLSNALVLWLVIFWAGYETHACVQFIKTLSGVSNEWSEWLLFRKAKETGVPRAHLDDYLDFQLIVHATQRIDSLIYLPFVSILFMVLSRSNFFDTMDFPMALVFVIGLALAYTLYSARLLRKSAEKIRTTTLKNYERLLSTPTWPPINAEQIKLIMGRIQNTREGAFAPSVQQPALQALLLPFGGYGSVQLIEFLFKL